MKQALLIMAKRPFPGWAKTRLSPPLSPAQSAGLYQCFLQDTIALVQAVPGVDRFVAAAPPLDVAYFSQLAPGFELLEQQGPTLSERLDYVLSHCSEMGYSQVVAINSDSPTLPGGSVRQAFVLLEQNDTDVVLGPCEDGGYYLIGWKKPHPRLVREVEMSTNRVLQDSLHIASQESLQVSLLPTWYDIDDEVCLQRLQADLAASPEGAYFTRQFLAQNVTISDDLITSARRDSPGRRNRPYIGNH